MSLKATKPESVVKRLKMFLFGSYKVGKTTAALGLALPRCASNSALGRNDFCVPTFVVERLA